MSEISEEARQLYAELAKLSLMELCRQGEALIDWALRRERERTLDECEQACRDLDQGFAHEDAIRALKAKPAE